MPAAVTPAPTHPASASAHPVVIAPASSTSIAKAVETYLARIGLETDDHHIEGKISMLRRFFGPNLFPYKRKPPEGKAIEKGYFKGTTGHDSGRDQRGDRDQILSMLPIIQKSKRHYRELFHHFFEVTYNRGTGRTAAWQIKFRYPKTQVVHHMSLETGDFIVPS